MKAIFFSMFFLVLGKTLNAQQPPTAFIYENVIEMTKDSIMKAGKLNINDTSYEIMKFTYIISAPHMPNNEPIYGTIKGNIFSQEFLTKLYQSWPYGTLIILDILVHKKYTDDPNRKLAQQLTINFRREKLLLTK